MKTDILCDAMFNVTMTLFANLICKVMIYWVINAFKWMLNYFIFSAKLPINVKNFWWNVKYYRFCNKIKLFECIIFCQPPLGVCHYIIVPKATKRKNEIRLYKSVIFITFKVKIFTKLEKAQFVFILLGRWDIQ